MSENKEVKEQEENKWSFNNDSDWIWLLLIFGIFGFGWNIPENLKINEIEEKISMIGEETHE